MTTTNTAPRPGRKALHAYLSDTAHSAWHDFAIENGVSVSAVLDRLAANFEPTRSDQTVGSMLENVVREARRLDAINRRRRR